MAKPQSRPGHQKNLSMGDFSRTDVNHSYNGTFGLKDYKAIADNSFYGSDLEPLNGFDSKQRNDATNHTMIEDYRDNDQLPTILPTIKQQKIPGEMALKGYTKPSTLGTLAGYNNKR